MQTFFYQYSAKKQEVTLTNKEADKHPSQITASYTLACCHLSSKTRHYTCSLKLPVAPHCSTCKVYQAVIRGDLRSVGVRASFHGCICESLCP